MPNEAPPPTAPPRRVRKRVWIPLLVLALFVTLATVAYFRGTLADTQPRFPATAAEGTLTHLYQRPDGNIEVRCSIVVPAAPDKVWKVVTDYGHHAEFLPYVSSLRASSLPGGQVLVEGVAHSRLWGDFPFRSKVTHDEKKGEQGYSASWSEEADGVVNQGAWLVKPAGPGQTLVTYCLRAEVKPYPDWLVRNILMDRLFTVLGALRDEVQKRP